MSTASTIEYFNIPLHNRVYNVTDETILYMNFNKSIADLTNRHTDITINGATLHPFSHEGNQSIKVHDIDEGVYIEARVDSDFYFRQDNFSISMTYFLDEKYYTTYDGFKILDLITSYGDSALTFEIASGTPHIMMSSQATGGTVRYSITHIPNQWNTIRVNRNSHGMKLYYNDILVVSYVGFVKNYDYNVDTTMRGQTLVLGNKIDNVSSGFRGWIDEIKIIKPLKVLNLQFNGAYPSDVRIGHDSHVYIDDTKRHEFVEEGTVAMVYNNGRSDLDARTGNIKLANNSNDFIFDKDFYIGLQIQKSNIGDATFFIFHNSLDQEQFALKYVGSNIQITGVSGVVLLDIAHSFDTSQFTWEIFRMNNKIWVYKQNTFIGNIIYTDIIDGTMMRIGGEGSGCGSFIKNFCIDRG